MAEHCQQEGCGAYAMTDDVYCFCHSPHKVKERAEARMKGGIESLRESGKFKVLEASNIEIKTSADVLALLSETINQVRMGQLEVKTSNCVGYLCGVVLQALDRQMEPRIQALEKQFAERDKPEWES